MAKKNIRLFLILSLVVLFFSACTREIGMVSTNFNNRMQGRYQLLDGSKTKSIQLDAGDQLELRLETVVEKGELILRVYDPDRILLWENEYTDATREYKSNYSLEILNTGMHRIEIVGKNTAGEYDLRWSVNGN